MRHLDLSLLRTFVAVAETGSATRAAERVHLTQAAVSQQLKRLEEGVGRPLLERGPRGFHPTQAGERMLAQARRMLALNDEVFDVMAAPDKAGVVRIGVPRDLAHPLLPPILKAFRQEWPRVELSLACDTSFRLLPAFERGEIDLCLTTELGRPEGAELLFPDPLVWLGAAGGDAWLREPLPIVLGDKTCAFRKPVLAALGSAGRAWRVVSEASEMTALFAAVEADLAVTALMLMAAPGKLLPIMDASLPALPSFNVNLYPPRPDAGRPAQELARLLRSSLGAGPRLAAERPPLAA